MTSEGNPFFAMRVDADLMRRFKRCAARRGVAPQALLRRFMRDLAIADEEREEAEVTRAAG